MSGGWSSVLIFQTFITYFDLSCEYDGVFLIQCELWVEGLDYTDMVGKAMQSK